MTRRLSLSAIGRGLSEEVAASPAELAAIATRLGVPAVGALSCRWRLAPAGGGAIDGEGVLSARVVQVCVVTLEPFEAVVAERFAVRFVPPGTERDDPDPETPDELAHDGTAIDLGEATVEQLALALDPYPRRPDAQMPAVGPAPPEAAEAPASPFAVLANRRRE